jgi:hypothetical protein
MDAALTTVDRGRYPHRMKDLCELTGLDRQTIHFYIQQGLVPEGQKTGRNMAYYGPEHVERIHLIRKLQNERFLPLKAIRAMLDGRDDQFTGEQRALLLDVKRLLGPALGSSDAPAETVSARDVCEASGVTIEELEAMVSVGLLSTVRKHGEMLLNRDDAWMIEHWGELRRAGLTSELGFEVADMAVYEDIIAALFARETEMLMPRLSHLPPAQVAAMVERALPIVNRFLARYHSTKVRNFFAALG